MEVPTIKMDREEARRRLEAYRAQLRRSADAEYGAVAAGYEALVEGTPVMQFGPAIRNAPRDEKGRPKLALARADRLQVKLRWSSGPILTFDCTKDFRQSVYVDSLLVRQVNMGANHGMRDPQHRYLLTVQGYALVPLVPPEALAAIGGRTYLREHLVLWEVEEWADQPIRAVPDRDPLLLRPLHGDLCAVVASWDLTDLERAVMAGRAGNG
jgi:hypothetical protein